MLGKILIVDDEPDVLKMLVFRLKAQGYEVFVAGTGEEGVAEAQKCRPDLVLLDYKLPDIPAATVAQRIRACDGLAHVPFILATASIDDIMEKSRECGVVAYIAKPVEPEELFTKVANHLGKRG